MTRLPNKWTNPLPVPAAGCPVTIGKPVGLITDPAQILKIRLLAKDFDIIIGIDPGVQTGFATWHKPTKELLAVNTWKIHRAIREILDMADKRYHRERILVRMEDARLRQWLPKEKNNAQYRGKLQGAGSVKRDSSIWEDFLTDEKIAFELLAPAAGLTKWKPDYFNKVTGWPGRTSSHGRDAAILCYGY